MIANIEASCTKSILIIVADRFLIKEKKIIISDIDLE
jgi:hypothetical protein